MLAAFVETEVAIDFEAGCSDGCAEFAAPLFEQLASGKYDYPASVFPLPGSIDEWEAAHSTARKRARRCEALGYRFAEIDRQDYELDVFEINTSAPERQGRPMGESYGQRPNYGPLPDYPCPRHALYTYGVLNPEGRLAAYTWIYRVGGLVMFSTILGHFDELDDHVMYLLVRETLEAQIAIGPGVAFYNRHDSGTEGLRFFKERCGFGPARARWELGA